MTLIMTPDATGLIRALLMLVFAASSAFALTDAKPHVSPDGRFMIVNVGDTAQLEYHFELRRSDGSVVFTFKNLPGFDFPSLAEHILWSKNGEFVALSVETGKYLQDTLVIATATGRALMVPTEDEVYQTRPVRWTQLGELVVETKAPFGGKADEDRGWARYQYRKTFRIRDGGKSVECVYKSATAHLNRAQFLREGYKPR